jgi:hypothetical protein
MVGLYKKESSANGTQLQRPLNKISPPQETKITLDGTKSHCNRGKNYSKGKNRIYT